MVAIPAIAATSKDFEAPASTAASSLDERLRRIANDEYEFVWRSLRRLGVPPPETYDAAQQVFIILMDKLATVEVGKERSFLFSIAMRVAANARRHRASRREVPEEEAAHAVSVPPAVDAEVDRAAARILLDEMLAGMSDERRAVFVLFELEGASLAEIAELLGIPLWTAASRLRRAREDLQAAVARFRARRKGA